MKKLVFSKNLQKISNEGRHLLYDSKLGSSAIVNDDALTFVDLLLNDADLTDFEINEMGNFIEMLVSKGFADYFDSDKSGVDAHKQHQRSGRRVNNLRLIITEKCNLDCEYCYERASDIYKQRREMSFETAKISIDSFFGMNSDNDLHISIRFFGGEPLMNFELIEQIIEYIENFYPSYLDRVNFMLNTNGTLINDDVAKLCKKYGIFVALSLDGDKDCHDKTRKTIAGGGSFDNVNEGIIKLIENGCKFNLCSVCTDENLPELKKFLDYVSGMQELYKYSMPVNFTFLHIPGGESLDTLSTETKVAYLIDAIKYAREKRVYSYGGISHFVFTKLLNGQIGSYCGGIGSEISVSPDGSVYPCSGNELLLGHISRFDDIFNSDNYKSLLVRVPGKIEFCKDCEIECFCAGGCAAQMDVADLSDDDKKKMCELMKETYIALVKEYVL